MMREFLRSIGRFLFNKSPSAPQPRPVFEQLESRQFLSAAPLGDSVCECRPADAHVVEAASTTDFHLADIIGKWKGTIQTNLRPRPYKATINITSITPAGKMSGTISIPFLLTNYKFSLNTKKSKVNPDGTFSAKFSKFGISGQLKGQYDDVTKHITGDFNATAPGKSVIGTFDFKKIN